MSDNRDRVGGLERAVLIAAILASSMAFLEGSALNVALPAMQIDLDASATELLWIVNAYQVMLAAFILVGGSLGDRLGRRKVFAAGMTLFMAASLVCGLAPTASFLIAARVLQGAGGALMIPGSLALINSLVSAERRGEAIGTWSAVTTVVVIIGPVLGGFLAGLGLWRLVFLIAVPVGLPALVVLLRGVPENRDAAAGPVDLPGGALAVLSLAGLTYGFIAAPDFGFSDGRVLLALAVGVLGLAAFVWVERRSAYPMMPLHVFRSATFSGANLLTFFLYGALTASNFFLALNLVQAQGYSEALAGLAFLPFSIPLALLSRWAGRWADRNGPRRLLILGPAAVGAGFILLALPGVTAGPAAYWTTYFPGVLLFGIGMGLTVAPLTTAVMAALPRRYSGVASGINNAISRTAGVLAVAILGSLALFMFQGQLLNHVSALDLPAPAVDALRSQAGELGALSVPAAVPAGQASAVEVAVRQSFAGTFRVILLVCAAMAFVSAGMAAWLIRDGEDQ
ncbi:MAG TPA: MFS transporter [Anaerolineaceae bacterium]|nr:MFS transporter [Anaerolineaceae bacterium]